MKETVPAHIRTRLVDDTIYFEATTLLLAAYRQGYKKFAEELYETYMKHLRSADDGDSMLAELTEYEYLNTDGGDL